MIRVDVCVENAGCVDRLDGLDQTRNRLRLAAFTEVWYTLDQSIADCRLPIVDC
jgi:hypothetical protein